MIELGHKGPLKELIKKIPYRDYLMIQRWREDQWNRPSRADHYTMAQTNVIQGLFGGIQPDLDKFKIVFESTATGEKKDPTIKSQEYVKMRQEEARVRAEMPKRVVGPRPPGPRGN